MSFKKYPKIHRLGKEEAVNFKVLKRIANKKAVQIYKDVILGDISVADQPN